MTFKSIFLDKKFTIIIFVFSLLFVALHLYNTH